MQERGIATRAALLEAALESLVELGYGATTTIEVARRAGVSRGAQLHHFPTRADLLTAAVESLFERRNAEFRKAFADLEPGVDQLDASIDLLWKLFQSPTYVAWAELWVAARTDPELGPKVVEIGDRFDQESLETFRELMPAANGDPEFQRVGLAFAYSLLNGMALMSLLPCRGLATAEELIEVLKAMARLFGPSAVEEEDR